MVAKVRGITRLSLYISNSIIRASFKRGFRADYLSRGFRSLDQQAVADHHLLKRPMAHIGLIALPQELDYTLGLTRPALWRLAFNTSHN